LKKHVVDDPGQYFYLGKTVGGDDDRGYHGGRRSEEEGTVAAEVFGDTPAGADKTVEAEEEEG